LRAAVLHEAIETGMFREGDRRLKLLDEAANVAPLSELPRTMSQVAGHGIRVATVWQSLAQMRERYGRGSDTIIATSTAKLYLGPITDDATRDHVVSLLGGPHHERGRRPRAGAASLQQLALAGDRALLVAGARLPALVTLHPYWRGRS
jgi:type IV secretory pathway TraG/TraD family ATPase VirD4